MRQLQALLQPQVASLEAMSDLPHASASRSAHQTLRRTRQVHFPAKEGAAGAPTAERQAGPAARRPEASTMGPTLGPAPSKGFGFDVSRLRARMACECIARTPRRRLQPSGNLVSSLARRTEGLPKLWRESSPRALRRNGRRRMPGASMRRYSEVRGHHRGQKGSLTRDAPRADAQDERL